MTTVLNIICVNQSCPKMHHLHVFVSAESSVKPGDFAELAFHREATPDEIIPLQLPVETVKTVAGEGGARTDNLVWKTALEVKNLPSRTVRLYRTSFSTTHPGVLIKSLSFRSTMTEAAPFLLGVTLE